MNRIRDYFPEVMTPDLTPTEHQGGTHASPKPHWRKGHWRTQRMGTGLADKKLIFIAPVMVMAALFTGDRANTEIIYK